MIRWMLRSFLLAIGSLAATVCGASEELAMQYGCTACHQVEFPSVGPAYVDVANKYRDADEETVAALVERVKAGTSGAWGPIEMPPQPLLTEEDARTIVAWILALECEQ